MTAQQGFPQVNSQIVDPRSGKITQPWYQLFISLWTRTGGSSGTASSVLDQITTTVGSILYRGSTTWHGLAPGTSGRVLTSQGSGNIPVWGAAAAGSVTSVGTGTGLTGGPITVSGTITMADMAADTLKGNNTGVSAAPSDLTTSDVKTMLGVTAVGTATVGQIPGTTTNDSASSGNIGEYVSASVGSGSAVALTTATAKTITQISLTAGDWDVEGIVDFTGGATTTVTQLLSSVSTTTNTVDSTQDRLGNMGFSGFALFANADPSTVRAGAARFSLSGTTTIYLVALASFGTNTASAYGIIRARRVR